MAKKFLLVYPNPFLHVDHDGYPNCACPCDMPEHTGMTVRRFVGAKFDQTNTFLLETLTEEELLYRNARQQTRFAFEFAEPTKLPVTEYYKDRVRGGELIAADETTARIGGVAYVEPKQVLADAKAHALKHWAALHGPDEEPELIDAHDKAIEALGVKPAAIATEAAPAAPVATHGDE